MSALGEFDKASAIMRLLLVLASGPKNMERIYMELKYGYGVDRTAMNSSVRAALRLGLIEQERRGRNLVTRLTVDGGAIAIRLRDIQAVLDESSTRVAKRADQPN